MNTTHPHFTPCTTLPNNSKLKRERNDSLKNTENYTSKLQDTERELNSLKAFSQRSLEDLQITRDELSGEWCLESKIQDPQGLYPLLPMPIIPDLFLIITSQLFFLHANYIVFVFIFN
jgi:hypothetical protein